MKLHPGFISIYLLVLVLAVGVIRVSGASMPQPTATAQSTFTPQATYTLQPTYTPLATHTAAPTYTPYPSPTAQPAQDRRVYLAFVMRNRGCWWCWATRP